MSDYTDLGMYIDGEWVGVGSRRTHKVLNPATGAVLGELPLADAADLDRALDAADRGFKLWRATPAADRCRVLKTAADLMRQRVERIARIATMEEGKTIGETRIETMAAAALDHGLGEVHAQAVAVAPLVKGVEVAAVPAAVVQDPGVRPELGEPAQPQGMGEVLALSLAVPIGQLAQVHRLL